MKWLMDATWYMQSALPELDLGKNEMYTAYCDFFARLTPIGARHISFGNRGYNEKDWGSSRITTFRRVAMLCQDGQAIQNWKDTRRRLQAIGMTEPMPFSPWIDYAMPFYADTPAPEMESDSVNLFSVEGWVMVSSAPPSDYEAQKTAVSMTFACRSRGGYSHAFRSENGFDIHAYGETIAAGGGNTSNQSHFANHSMSHNTVLINGHEQIAARADDIATCGRIVAFHRGEDFVYWAGDATPSYGPETGLGRFVRHVLFVDGAYFVIFDDLAVAEGYDAEAFQMRYAVGETQVVVQHVAGVEDLRLQDRKGTEGLVNPLTGEDLRRMDKWLAGKDWKQVPEPIEAHHLWVSHQTPRKAAHFLSAIVPFLQGEDAPEIRGLNDQTVGVKFRGAERVFAFGGEHEADIRIDFEAIQGKV
jgi:hypothetical protein